MSMKVVLASKNKHKLEEISKITEKFDIELILQSACGVDIDVEENGATFEENSYIKAKAVMDATGLPALALLKERFGEGCHGLTSGLVFEL